MEDTDAPERQEPAPEAPKECKGPCKRTLPPDSFRITGTYKGKSYRDGLCVECRAEKSKATRRQNAVDMEKLLEQRVDSARDRWQARKDAAEAEGLTFEEPFEWTYDDIKELYDEQGRCCAVTKLPFITEFHPNYDERLFAPSLDQIEPGKGYVKGNVRLVLWYVNRTFSLHGADIFMLVAEAAVKHAVPKETLSDAEQTPLERMRALLDRPRDEKPWHDKTPDEKETHNTIVNGLKDVLAAPDLTLYAVPDPDQPNQSRVVGTTFTRRSGEFVDTRPKPDLAGVPHPPADPLPPAEPD